MNCQPIGFYPIEALKEDARRFGVPFWNPCVNRSEAKCTAESGGVRLGLEFVKNVGPESAMALIDERKRRGPYASVGDVVQRVRLKPEAIESLVAAGALNEIAPNKRQALWEAGLYFSPSIHQTSLPISMDQDVPQLANLTPYQKMLAEYAETSMYPKGHLMEFLRTALGKDVRPATEAEKASENEVLTVAGWPVARQHPRGEKGTVFVTIEDETGELQLILWPQVFEKYRKQLNGHVIIATGSISRWDGMPSLVVSHVKAFPVPLEMPTSHDWH